jgi:hypothetical protein
MEKAMKTLRRVPNAWLLAVTLAATACPPTGITITKPRVNALEDDPGVAIEVKVPQSFTTTTNIVRIDGVDLIAALGLTPPFADATGNVVVGADTIAVSNFDYVIPPTGPVVISATLAGLPAANHTLQAEAHPAAGGSPNLKNRTFAVVEPMTLEAEVIASSGTPAPPPVIGNHAGNATLGEPLAAPPVALSGGGELRAGYVPAAQARAGGL